MSKSNIKEKILVVDDSPDTLEVIRRNLLSEGFRVLTADSVSKAAELLETEIFDLVITDYKMPKVSGLDLIRHVRENFPDTEVMMITGYATVENAVEAVKTGAEEYLPKPFTDAELFAAVNRVLEKLRTRRMAQSKTQKISEFHGLIGKSPAMTQVYEFINKASTNSATVLLTGESGTGKELVARAIHYSSKRSSAPFVPVNCGAIPGELMESELFGHVKGAFTGAMESRAGFFQTADGGTIFLDEISEMSLPMQVKLLRVLQEKKIYMVGSSRATQVDIRIIAASNKDLLKAVQKDQFREDLFYRLNVLTISIPPLRERGDDILLLVNYFLEKFSQDLEKEKPKFTDKALQVLKNYSWPGNVRELENIIQRIVIMTDKGIVDVDQLPSLMKFYTSKETGLNKTLEDVEVEHIRRVLQSVDGNKTQAAKILGIDRKTLRNKLERYEGE
jgi:DNA-binding NtrC family response regulator